MKLALLGDVHGNLPALEAVLEDAAGQGVDEVWNVGDFVGYGPFPDETVRRLREVACVNIVGNYDRKVLRFERRREKWRLSKHPEKFLAFRWAWEHLSPESIAYLSSLPQQARREVEGRRVLACHGSPVDESEHLRDETSEARLRELARDAQADVIVCGHSHSAFERRVDGVLFVNTGTVGRPDDGDPRACYAVLSVAHTCARVQHRRVAYDVDRVADRVRELGLPESFAQMFLTGRCLDDVAAQ